MKVVIILLAAFAAAALLVLLAGLGFFIYACARTREIKPEPSSAKDELRARYLRMALDGSEWLGAQPCEEVSIKSFDKLTLRGRYLYGGEKTVLLVHGYRSTGGYDYGEVARVYLEHGFSVLVIDQRAHGASDGRFICFGAKERRDVAGWCELLAKRGCRSLIIHGVSMGAASVLLATSCGLPDCVKGVIADCGYTSAYDEFRHVLRAWFRLPEYPLMPAFRLWCRLLAGFDPKEYSTLDALRTNRLPVLFIHGRDDNFVPYDMSRRNFDACAAEKEFISVAGAGHAQSYLVEKERVTAAALGFAEKYCK